MQDLDDVGREPRFNLFVRELVGHRVELPVDRDVVINIHAGHLPVCILEAIRWARPQRRSFELLEEVSTALPVPPHHVTIQIDEQLPQARVQRAERVEHLVADARKQPSLRDLDSHLHLRLVAWVQRLSPAKCTWRITRPRRPSHSR